MEDYRSTFIGDVEIGLHEMGMSPADISRVSGLIMKKLDKYELSPRSTALTVYDDENERILKRFIACLRIAGKSEGTVKQYARTCRKFFEFCGKPYHDVGVYEIRFYLATLKEGGLSNRSVENQRANLSAFFSWLCEEDLIPKSPCAAVKPVKFKQEVKKAFSTVEIDKLRSACRKSKERAIIEVLLASGVRVHELISLDVSDINVATKTIHIREGKGSKERTAYITDLALVHLEKYLHERKEQDSPVLFSNGMNGRMTEGGIRELLKRLENRAEVANVHPHRFRRTLATMLSARGMPIQEIQRILGHAEIKTTLGYICLDDQKTLASYKQYAA